MTRRDDRLIQALIGESHLWGIIHRTLDSATSDLGTAWLPADQPHPNSNKPARRPKSTTNPDTKPTRSPARSS